MLRLQAQLVAVLGVQREPGVLGEGVAQGLQEGVVELAGRATAAEGARDDLTEPARIRVRRAADWGGHVQNGTIRPAIGSPGDRSAPDYTGEMSVLDAMAAAGHEQVVLVADARSGLRAIIAIHSTTLGPALGGVRFWHYDSEDEALRDALRLARR